MCCCYSGGAGIVKYTPDGGACSRKVNSGQVILGVVLALVVGGTALVTSTYLGSSWNKFSPYPGPGSSSTTQQSEQQFDEQAPAQQQGQFMREVPAMRQCSVSGASPITRRA